jgi:hypothetical protein
MVKGGASSLGLFNCIGVADMLITFESDQVTIPRLRAQQEAVLQEIRGALARPLVLNGAGRIVPITAEQIPTQMTRAEVVPFRKRDEPAKHTSPKPPTRPAPSVPYRTAAEKLQKHDQRLGDQLIAALRRA